MVIRTLRYARWKDGYWPYRVPGGGGGFPSVAFKTSGGNWFVDDSNSVAPDGYATSADGINFFIDTAASSGLTLVSSPPNLFVAYP